jgi:phosphopantothenoylcysteine decarboxylase/phosphopantothenate--cysteine ligase
VEQRVDEADVVFGVAAVADARPAERCAGKPAKAEGPQTLTLVPNPDVIAAAAARPGRRAVIGFSLESEGGGLDGALQRARGKLLAKGLDAIAVNLSSALAAEESEVVLLFADGREERLPRQSKDATAARLVEVGLELWKDKA